MSIGSNPFVEEVPAALPAHRIIAKEAIDMTQYLLSVWHDDTYDIDVNGADAQRMFAQVDAFNAEVQAAGAWVFAGGLHPASSATVVSSANGDVSMTDGPYAESKEQMGGFWVIEAADLDAALAWAGKGSAACEGPVEVRPFQGG
ncbi:MAG TPA: YciI family protein [Ilumatobacteraceae bacterium]